MIGFFMFHFWVVSYKLLNNSILHYYIFIGTTFGIGDEEHKNSF